MELSFLARFVHQCATDSGVNYTLDGEDVTPKDLADEQALLPLVVASINAIHEEISGLRSSHLTLLEPADPDTHLLGWRIKSLPKIQESVTLIYTNTALREYLAHAPAARLRNPLSPHEARSPEQVSELRAHLVALGLGQASAKPRQSSEPSL